MGALKKDSGKRRNTILSEFNILAQGQTRVESSQPPFPLDLCGSALHRWTSLSSGHKMLVLF